MTALSLEETLPKLVQGQVSYVAGKGNAGDALIAAATGQVLDRLGIVVGSEGTVLVAGGGGLIPRYDCMAKTLAKVPRDKKVIILPSTVAGYWQLLGEFRNLTLLAREEVTLSLARMNGIRTLLCEDAAFSFDYSPWTGGEGTLVAMRADAERSGRPLPENNRDVSLESTGWWGLHNSMIAARKFVQTISRHAMIDTDRCHVAIVGAMLGKQVTLRPGNYHKNRSVWSASLERRGVEFLEK